jgi:uncharacterized protein
VTLGVISDTHGLLRKEALDGLRDCGLIIHAGDVGEAGILAALEQIAPVVAVKGNVDTGEWASALPASAVAEFGERQIYVLHDIHDLDLDPAIAGFQVVISGHSHKPGWTEKSGVIYLNPGSAGPRRFRLPITVARVEFAGPRSMIRFIDLETRQPHEI